MIEWKPKKRKCKAVECGERFIAQSPIIWWCSPECGAKVAMQKLDKLRASEAKKERVKTALRKRSLKPMRKLLAETQAAFNKFIRERDFCKPCISCGRVNDGLHQRHAGHYKSVGSSAALRFDEENCHAQCSQCNNHLSGNILNYRERLIERIGQEAVDRLEGPQGEARWPADDLEDMKRRYNREARLLERKRTTTENN